MLGIIGAMDVEVRTIKDKMTGTVTTRAAGCDFVTGELEGVMITVVQCAPGKVNAALCTQLLIDRFQVDRVINIGVACSLSERVVIKNIVIATDVCQYDIDITALASQRVLSTVWAPLKWQRTQPCPIGWRAPPSTAASVSIGAR